MTESDTFINVRRTALVLTPKQPLYDWVKSMDPIHNKDIGPMGEPDVYLLPDYETTEEMEDWLNIHFDWFFCEQLNNWYIDERLWPQNRTIAMFKDWFEYSLHTMVWDSQDGPIEKMH